MFVANPINVSVETKMRILQGEPMLDNSHGLVVVSERDYREMEKAVNNAEYLEKLNKSREQFKRGETISFTMEELEAMEADDWVPTQKVLDFMERMRHE